MTRGRFSAPQSLAEAVQILKSNNGTARILAGGTDLLVQIRIGVQNPDLIVDIKRIPEIMALTLDAKGLRIGSAVPAGEIWENQALKEAYPGLAEASDLIGSTQIQSRASLGGNLCNASPAADTVPALVVLEARCRIAGPGGERTVAVEAFTTGPGATVHGASELLVDFEIDARPPRSADAYLRFIPRTEMDIAVVGVGVDLTLAADGTCTRARVALGAVAPTVVTVPEAARALVGSRLDDDALARAAEAAAAACNPIDDKRGTVAFRRKVAGVLVRRAAAIAAERAARR